MTATELRNTQCGQETISLECKKRNGWDRSVAPRGCIAVQYDSVFTRLGFIIGVHLCVFNVRQHREPGYTRKVTHAERDDIDLSCVKKKNKKRIRAMAAGVINVKHS